MKRIERTQLNIKWREGVAEYRRWKRKEINESNHNQIERRIRSQISKRASTKTKRGIKGKFISKIRKVFSTKRIRRGERILYSQRKWRLSQISENDLRRSFKFHRSKASKTLIPSKSIFRWKLGNFRCFYQRHY